MATNTPTRWDPFAELANMRTTMDRLFGNSFSRLPSFRNGGEEFENGLALDVYETDNEMVVKAAIPGMDPKDVDISIDEDRYLRRELHWGGFSRQLRLPPTVDAGKADAMFENGVLTLKLPKKPESRTKVIHITPKGVIGEGKSGHNGNQ